MQGIQINPIAELPPVLMLVAHAREQVQAMLDVQQSTDPAMTEAHRGAIVLDMARRLLQQIRGFVPTTTEGPQQ